MDPSNKEENLGPLIDLDAPVSEEFQFNIVFPSGNFNAELAISDVFGSSPTPPISPAPPIHGFSSSSAPFSAENASSFGGGDSANSGFGTPPVPIHNGFGVARSGFGAAPTGFRNHGFGCIHSPAEFQSNGFDGPEDFVSRESEASTLQHGNKSYGMNNSGFGNVIRSHAGFDGNNNNGVCDPDFSPSQSNSFAPVRLSPSSHGRFESRNDQECDMNPATASLSQHSTSPAVFPTGDFHNRPVGGWSPRNSPAKRRRDRCNRCGRYGHMTELCYTNTRNAGSIRCYNCNRVGHLAIRCFEPRAAPRGRRSVSVISGGSPTDENSIPDFGVQPATSTSGGRVHRQKFIDIVDPNNAETTGVGIVCKMMQDPHLRKDVMRLVPETYDDMMNFMMMHVKL